MRNTIKGNSLNIISALEALVNVRLHSLNSTNISGQPYRLVYNYDACDVTLSVHVYPHWASLKNMPDHGGNRTYDLWNTLELLKRKSDVILENNRITGS